MAINYEGTYATIRAFLPDARGQRRRARERPLAAEPGQHAADDRLLGLQGRLHSLTQALRPVLQTRGISVHGVYPAGIDTEMVAGIEVPKTAPRAVADALLDGIERGDEDIFPDPNAQAMSEVWFRDPKAFERAFATASRRLLRTPRGRAARRAAPARRRRTSRARRSRPRAARRPRASRPRSTAAANAGDFIFFLTDLGVSPSMPCGRT